jgi:hypothetical protein
MMRGISKTCLLTVASLALCASGSAQSFQFRVQQGSTVTPATDGSTVSIPAEAVGRLAQATITATYTGVPGASVTDVRIGGSADFSVSGVPSLPQSLTTGQSFSFGIRYSPTTSARVLAQVYVQYTESATVKLATLNASGVAPEFTLGYILPPDNNFTPLLTGSRLLFPLTGINSTTVAAVVVSNRGSGSGAVGAVTSAGSSFLLQGLPALPVTVEAGGSLRFNVAYTPRQTGLSAGSLQVYFADRNIQVNLEGATANPDFSVSYFFQSDGNAIPLFSGGRISFPAIGINSSTTATVVINNRAGGGGHLNSISLTGTGFQLGSTPSLPLFLDVGRELRFSVVFAPKQAGQANGLLQLAFSDRVVLINLDGSTASADLTVSYFLPTDGNMIPLSTGSAITFPATSINTSATITVVVSNRGAGAGLVNSVAISGGSFQLVNLPVLPATLESGRELRFGVAFSPTAAGNQSGTLSLAFADRILVVPITATTATSDFKVSYFVQTDGNGVFVESGGKIVFPSTRTNATTGAVVALSNYGTGAGYISSITLTGEAFQLTGVAALPILIGSGRELRFGIAYSPTRLETSTGTLRIVVDDKTLTLDITGTSTGPQFSYAIYDNGSASSFYPRDIIPLPETALRETTTLTLQVKNLGNTDGTIGAIVVSGQGFRLSNLPILPVVLAPDGIIQFSLIYAPVEAGAASGRLQIGADAFDLIATAKGAKLLYSYVGGAGPVVIQDARTVLWGNVEVGQSSQTIFVVRNDGTGPATISSVGIVDARSAFRLINTPGFPATLAAGGQLSFSLVFSPTALGDNSARLRVDAETFTLIGSGTAPPSLPAVELRGLASALEPMQQPAVSLTLASPYPLPLTGTLVLTVNSRSFSVDPAVQFATGGRTVAFTVPANSTKAQFPGGSEIRLQTGTVAATISVAATFATEGGLNITPEAAPAMSFEVAETAPRVLDIQIDSRTTSGFTIVVTGLSTTRTLKQMDLNFAASSNFNLPNGRFSVSIESASAAWYRSVESQAYGSLFTARIPFSLQGLNDSLTLNQVFQSISASLTNEKGQSNSLSVTP